MKQYTNELTPEIIHGIRNPHTESELAELREDERKFILEDIKKRAEIPIVAIYRYACEGALTRDGGVLRKASSRNIIRLKDGTELRYALVGDEVSYPNGRIAKIISGTGKRNKSNGRSFALVGSELDNGDVIVSTPQNGRMLVEFDDNRFGDGFLKPEVLEV
ncbi:PAAR domain-containing protein [Enterobacter cloacae]|uniref:PAAR domain-containing protein n=1 Tax=Enterobacter cloacae TaxID=550 RepID=A0A144V649_ENTCL|nr:PAAR domain-containing protein [Enterobacter cloacae]CZW49214.1 Uncharacterised protein [Enterobacter cloacae]SAH89650.1 Uncharacterised protein [Enterobacter cloacae]